MRVRRSASSSALRSRLVALARAQSAHQRRSVARPSATTTSANSHELSRSCGRNGSAIGGRDGDLGRCAASPEETDDEPMLGDWRSAAIASRRRRGDGYFFWLSRASPQKRPARGVRTRQRTTRHRANDRGVPRARPSHPLSRPAPRADAGPPFNPSDDVTHRGASVRADADVPDRPDRAARPRVARPSRSKQDAWASRPSRGPPSRRVASLRRLPRRRAPPPAIVVLVDGWSVSSRGRGRDRRQAARASPRRRRQ